jgi:hypothetical protein
MMTPRLGFALLFAVAAQAATPAVQMEIARLLDGLRKSGCKFQRNGTWHEGSDAADHLAKKRDYYASKGKIRSTEDFIEMAASESALSGKAYRVACPEQPEVESKEWLEARLKELRAKK